MSLGLVVVCALAYRESKPLAVVVAIGGVLFSFLLIMLSPMIFAHAFFNCVASIGLAICRVRTKTFLLGLAFTAAGLYALAIGNSMERIQALTALRAKYPFQSLEQRLAFERDLSHRAAATNQPIVLTPAVEQRLGEFEERRGHFAYFDRAWSLQELHEYATLQFARAAGFGIARMGYIYTEDIDLPPTAPLALPVPLDRISERPSALDLLPVHAELLFDFGDRNRTGYVRSRREVSGFEPHQVTKRPTMPTDEDPPTHWQVNRLELVSLLRHDTPRVYTAPELPAMDQLADVPHRELNRFELASLPKLESDEDLVVDQQPSRIQMLGAIRAATSCLDCHDCQRGQLLGAFSYELSPVVNSNEAAD
ncbi:MAG: hypothetical protein AB7I57_14580 [Pirellulales bacterium]